jgi:hypothetical protein
MVAAPVGTAYPAELAPANHFELSSMTLEEISALAEWANDHFGIADGDVLAARLAKLQMHYMRE